MSDQPARKSDEAPVPVGLWSTFKSVASAFFGVQSSKNRQRDFTHGSFSNFFIIAVVMTAGFILIVFLAAKLALKLAGT